MSLRPSRAVLRRAAAVTGLVVAVWAGWSAWLVVPRGQAPVPADAVVMLAGADDGRHALARDLVTRGTAPVLVVSNPEETEEPKAWWLCHDDGPPVEAICVVPDPGTTWGEALAVDVLARERGWHRVVVVTNRPHTARVRATFARGTDLDVRVVPIDRVDWPRLPVHAAWEAAGWAKGWALGRW